MEDSKLKNKSIETYSDDLVKAIQADKGDLIKKIIHEEEKNKTLYSNLSPKSKKNMIFMIGSFLLIVLALAIFLYLFIFNKKEEVSPFVKKETTSIIYTDTNILEAIDGFTKEKIAETVFNQSKNINIKIGEIKEINLTENGKNIGFRRFNALLESNLNLGEADLFSDNFLLGMINEGFKGVSSLNGELFILLKVKSFTDVFPLMRAWENKMFNDLYMLFGIDVSIDDNYLFTKDWQDGVVKNKNTRILYDNEGEIVLMYVYINDSSIIITNSKIATEEVTFRITSSQIKK